MTNFLHITSPLDQFEIRNLLSLDAPILGNLSLSITNIGLYLTIAGYLVFILNIMSTNNNRIISNP
jgi:F-type H+-transporting ATPase subunit a